MEFSQRSLVIGKGQIGQSLYKVLKKHKSVFIRDVKGPQYSNIDVLHIAFPYSETFVADVANYIEQYNPGLTIVYSTVPIGTCEQVGPYTVHSPIEGRHPHLATSIELGVRWIGCGDEDTAMMAVTFWSEFVKVIRTTSSSKDTEFLKLRSTAKFGINLVWTDYEKSVADAIGMGFDALKQFDEDYNELYDNLGMHQFQRYILDAPEGRIGGHCVTPNAELLDKQYPNDMLKMISAMKKEGKQ